MTMANRLAAQFAQCTAEDIQTGGLFYPILNEQLRRVAESHRLPMSSVVGAFALLSPKARLDGNLRSLLGVIRALEDGTPLERVKVAGFNRGRGPAALVLQGEADFDDLVLPRSRKIRAFRHNILFAHDVSRDGPITIDGHMIAMMLGKKKLGMTEAEFEKRKAGGYDVFESAFRRWAKKRVGERKMSDLQAVLWCGRLRGLGRPHSNPDPVDPARITSYGLE